MNNENSSTDNFVAESLRQRFSLSAPEGVKAALIYRCGEAAAESRLQRHRVQNGWITAALVLLGLGVGGITGRFSNQTLTHNNFVKSNQKVESVDEERVSPKSNLTLASNPEFVQFRPENALIAGMDLDQVMLTLAKNQPIATLSNLDVDSETRPFSVWMSTRDLASLTSF